MIYIDIYMVRAGIVNHHADWKESVYYEILRDKKRYSILNPESLEKILNSNDIRACRDYYKDLISEAPGGNEMKRKSFWSEIIAVGDNKFVFQLK